jgi:hypothetical protein
MPTHYRYTYNDIHNIIKNSAPKVAEFKPDIIIAIGRQPPPVLTIINLFPFFNHQVAGSLPYLQRFLQLIFDACGIRAFFLLVSWYASFVATKTSFTVPIFVAHISEGPIHQEKYTYLCYWALFV